MGFISRPLFTWQLRTRKLALGERTLLMAIVNLTPDSFSGDGFARDSNAAVQAAIAAIDGGADILDIGAESTRPGATPISAEEEQARLLPVLEALLRERPKAIVSVDTYHASTAIAAAQAGAEIVNDVSGLLWDANMAGALTSTGCGLVLMHTRGKPWEWNPRHPPAPQKISPMVIGGLRERLTHATSRGIAAEKIVLDPGFGFGKVGRENVSLLSDLAQMHAIGRPLLIGLSRKGFLGEAVRALQSDEMQPAEARRAATLAGNVAATLSGAHILRVHDLQLSREAAAVADAVLSSA